MLCGQQSRVSRVYRVSDGIVFSCVWFNLVLFCAVTARPWGQQAAAGSLAVPWARPSRFVCVHPTMFALGQKCLTTHFSERVPMLSSTCLSAPCFLSSAPWDAHPAPHLKHSNSLPHGTPPPPVLPSEIHSAFNLLPVSLLHFLACHSKPLYSKPGFCRDAAA